ncbi:MAG: NAD(P)/FAD-dependent oxidoreductase [Myxococcota bacterium]|jgi:cation diffusion facilitator CzcD-associated flavoprotein CzcO|nr:NAD(P)/FAD-dependent oxidoreductase [Myxococcota bacterium]
MTQHVDVLIVGAGLSGIGAAVHLQKAHPRRSFAIFEARDAIGGTWDLFRYPGIRSDSDMFTLGYVFKPWTDSKAIADGPSILRYVRETAAEHGIDRHIRFRHRVVRATWSSTDARWTVEADVDGERVRTTCQFLYVCSGYYRYDAGYTPEFPGRDRYRGTFVHPQHWPEDLDYTGKKVVVIGSGATAVTLVPAMAEKAAHVTMLQRTPTYIASLPSEDAIATFLREHLPSELAYGLARWKNILLSMALYQLARKSPQGTKRRLLKLAAKELPPDFDVETHLSPDYAPWDQRLCLVPDADLFHAIRDGRASIVTGHIDTFTEKGLRLKTSSADFASRPTGRRAAHEVSEGSWEGAPRGFMPRGGGSGDRPSRKLKASGNEPPTELEADVVVSATGLQLLFAGGMELFVDGKKVETNQLYTYKGTMFSGVPNLALAFGYTNASWTLKADLIADYVCRLLKHLDQTGARYFVPVVDDPSLQAEPFLDFSSGYVQRALPSLPKQGSKTPWKLYQNYLLDLWLFRYAKLEDGAMRFVHEHAPVDAPAVAPVAVASR